MAGWTNKGGPQGTMAAMQEAARPPDHAHPHDHPDLDEIVDDHAGHINDLHDQLDAHLADGHGGHHPLDHPDLASGA